MKNVCIVGYGAISPVHARALEHVRKARLYAVCNTDEKYYYEKHQIFVKEVK